jgi:hypothetical protein
MNWNHLGAIASIVFVDPTYAYLALIIVGAGVLLIYLIVKSSDEFSVEETELNSDSFAGEIRDSHGPVTKWLWTVYIALVVWAIAYLLQHWAEFASFP